MAAARAVLVNFLLRRNNSRLYGTFNRHFSNLWRHDAKGSSGAGIKRCVPIFAGCLVGFTIYSSHVKRNHTLHAADFSSWIFGKKDETPKVNTAQETFQPVPEDTGGLEGDEIFEPNPCSDFVVAIGFSRTGVYALSLGKMKGSGVIVSADGFVITSASVVLNSTRSEDQDRFNIFFPDGKIVEGKLVHVDKDRDLAAIKTTGIFRQLEFAPLAESYAVENGDEIILLSGTFKSKFIQGEETVGTVIDKCCESPEVKEDKIEGLPYKRSCIVMSLLADDIKETFAGGPVVNEKGEVLGVISSVKIIKGREDKRAEAIPLEELKQFLEDARNANQKLLEEKLRLRETTDPTDLRRRLGMKLVTIRPGDAKKLIAKGFDIPDVEAAVLVISVEHQMLADRIGLRSGDVITWMNDEAITNAKQVFWISHEEDKLHFKLIRNHEDRIFNYKCFND